MKRKLISLRGRGWPVVGECIAVIRLPDQPGFAVGCQAPFRSHGTGRVWPSLRKARRHASRLADINQLPIVESI
jgi:hypothetical protein